jgi:hypothetical protein
MLRPLFIGVFLVACVSCPTIAEERPTPNIVDAKQATIDFAQLFKETCFENRSDLEKLRALAAAREWKELEGSFPFLSPVSVPLGQCALVRPKI